MDLRWHFLPEYFLRRVVVGFFFIFHMLSSFCYQGNTKNRKDRNS